MHVKLEGPGGQATFIDEWTKTRPSEDSTNRKPSFCEAQSLSVSASGFVCKSCHLSDRKGAKESICALAVLGCLQALFALETDVVQPADVQEERIVQTLSGEDWFKDLVSATADLQGHAIPELLATSFFCALFVLSAKVNITDELPVEAQTLSAFRDSTFPIDEAAAVIFSASEMNSSPPESYYAASFRFQHSLGHRFAVIESFGACGQVQVGFLDSVTSVCSRVSDTFQRRGLIITEVYTLTAVKRWKLDLGKAAVSRSNSPFSAEQQSGCDGQSIPEIPYPQDDHATLPHTPNVANVASSTTPQSTEEDTQGIPFIDSQEPAISQPTSHSIEGENLQEAHFSVLDAQQLSTPLSLQSVPPFPPQEIDNGHQMSPSGINPGFLQEVEELFSEPSSSLGIANAEDDDDDLLSIGLESPPPYEPLSPNHHTRAEVGQYSISNPFATSEERQVESSSSISSSPSQQPLHREVTPPRSLPLEERGSTGRASRARPRKPNAGPDFGWMMALQETSVARAKLPKPTPPQEIQNPRVRPSPQGATTSSSVIFDNGQLELLFKAPSSRRTVKGPVATESGGTPRASVVPTPESTRPQSGKGSEKSDTSPIEETDSLKAVAQGPHAEVVSEESMSTKAKLKEREPPAPMHNGGEFQWQLDLQASPSTARVRQSKHVSRGESSKNGRSGDTWTPLLLRPELLEKDPKPTPRYRGEGSSKPLKLKPKIRPLPPNQQSPQSYNKSRNDIAWQLALVSKVLSPSEDYLKEREEKFIQLNPRYKPEKFECLICFETILGADGARVMNCEHSFCRDCLTGHVRSQLEENQYPILCPVCFPDPERTSRGFVDEVVLEDLELSEKELEKFAELQMAAVIVKIDCPGCKGNMVVAREDYLAEPFIACNLPGCKSRFCRACRMVMKGQDDRHTCKIDEELDALMKANGWRYCPGCRTPIQKDSGCNHMTCKSRGCTTHFCYVCGDSIWNAQSPQSLSTLISAHYRNCNQFDVDPPVPPPQVAGNAQAVNARAARECAIQ